MKNHLIIINDISDFSPKKFGENMKKRNYKFYFCMICYLQFKTKRHSVSF